METFNPNRKLQMLDLNPNNVLSLYKKCLISKENLGKNPEDELHTKIFTKESCGKDSPEFIFSKSEIDKHTLTIKFLLGQLKATHDNLERIYFTYGNY